jgi:hypothetical protein
MRPPRTEAHHRRRVANITCVSPAMRRLRGRPAALEFAVVFTPATDSELHRGEVRQRPLPARRAKLCRDSPWRGEQLFQGLDGERRCLTTITNGRAAA